MTFAALHAMTSSLKDTFDEPSRTLEATWTITDFLSHESETFIESGQFWAPAPFDAFKWKLRVYPIGKSFISPHIVLVTAPRPVEVAFMFQTIDTPFGPIKKSTEVNQKEFVEGREWSAFCIDFEPRRLPFNARTPGLTIKSIVQFTDFVKAMSAVQAQEARGTLFVDMVKMYEDNKYTDVQFIVEGRTLTGHRSVLAARSPVFETMFDFDLEETYNEIVDVEYEVMKAILRFAYTSLVDLNDVDFAIKLFEAADKYDLKQLILACEEYVLFNINTDTVVRALIAGHFHNSRKLREGCSKYMAVRDKATLADYEQLDNFAVIRKELEVEMQLYKMEKLENRFANMSSI